MAAGIRNAFAMARRHHRGGSGSSAFADDDSWRAAALRAIADPAQPTRRAASRRSTCAPTSSWSRWPIPAQIVGLSPYASDPKISTVAEQARTFPRLPLQAEALVPLEPDLVLVGTWDRPLTQRLLRSLGFRVVGVDVVSDLDAARAQIREIAALLGHPERGEALIARDRRRAAAARGGAAAGVVERAADRQRRLHGRARQPRVGADGRGRAHAAAPARRRATAATCRWKS